VNDLAATAMAVPLLRKDELVALNAARPRREANIALVAPGTGLGQALLIYDNGRYLPVPGEAGHADFAPNSEDDVRLWRYLQRRWGHVSVERVASGSGLVNIHDWLVSEAGEGDAVFQPPASGSVDPARAIVEAALKREDTLCEAALKKFVALLGAVAGDVALTGLTLGGVYLGGGIPPKILPALEQGGFMNAFLNKGRFSELLARMPVRVIMNPGSAIMGAAWHAVSDGE